MIVIEKENTLVLVQQSDHAHLSGQMLSLWVDDGLPCHPRRAEIIYAGRHHDNGWREEDAVPRLDRRSLLPHTFLTLPAAARIDIWLRSVARYAESRPFAAALIHRHALGIHRSVACVAPYDRLVAEVDESLARLLDRHAIDHAEVEESYPLIELTDVASLAACRQFRSPIERAGRRLWLEGATLFVTPFPLAGATRFSLACREIDRRDYHSSLEIAGELARAPWMDMEILIAPPPEER